MQELLNHGLSLHRSGRLDAARRCYEEVVARDPGSVDGLYLLAILHAQQGRHEASAENAARLVALAPGHAAGHAHLGSVQIELRRPVEALVSLERAIATDPALAEAHYGRGLALATLGRREEAVAAFDTAIGLRPGHWQSHYNRGVALYDLTRVEQAIASFESAITLAAGVAAPNVNLAIALQEIGRAAEAREAIERALAIDPRSARAWSVRSDMAPFAPGDPGITAMEALLAEAERATAPNEDRLDLGFALGKAWMDVSEDDRAFAHFARANREKRASIGYDVDADIQRLRATTEVFSADMIGRFRETGDPSQTPIFLIGMPRSGTTLVEQILASHPAVHGAGELDLVQRLIESTGRPDRDFPGGARDWSAATIHALGRDYVGRIKVLAQGKPRVVDKMPGNFRFAGAIHLMTPNARIIHCRRDAVDTCLSCYTRHFVTDQGFTYDMEDLGRYYRAYERLMAHWKEVLPRDRLIEVRYEDVVDDLENTVRGLLDACRLEWDDACLRFAGTRRTVRTASMNQVRRDLYRDSIGKRSRFERHLGPLLQALER